MSYGSAISPKTVHDTAVRSLTKAAYAHLAAKALVRAGMVPLPLCSSYDALDSRYEEGLYGFGGLVPFVFFFDFPSADTFTVDGVVYRPCLGMRYSGEGIPTSDGYSGETFAFDLYARPATTCDVTTFRSEQYWRSFGTEGYGMGGGTSPWASYANGAVYYNHKWLPTNRPEWASLIGSAGYAPLVVGNVFVSLGKGGLAVSIGRSPAVPEFASYHSFSVVFHGDRIPSRGLPPMSDTNRNLLNPTALIQHRSTDGGHLAVPGAYHHAALALGGQYNRIVPQAVDAGRRLAMVHVYLLNLSNLEENNAHYDKYAFVRKSPRAVLGVGRHILEPLVGYLNNEYLFPTPIMGRVNPDISTTLACPKWEDYFYAPYARWADITAPLGEYVDPDTSLNWWITPPLASGAKLAFNVEGATNTTTATLPAYGAATTESYDLTSAGFSSVFPRSPVLFPQEDSISGGLISQNFTPVPATNAMVAAYGFVNVGYFRRTRMTIPSPTSEDREELFEAVFRAHVRSTQTVAPIGIADTPSFRFFVSDVFGNVLFNSLVILAGRSSGEQGYNLTEYAVPLPRAHRADSVLALAGGFMLGFSAHDPDVAFCAGAWEIRIEDIRLRRRKRV
jgi:hypothetical protein